MSPLRAVPMPHPGPSVTRRWLVVIVRLPVHGADAVRAPLGRPFRQRGERTVPAVVHSGSDWEAAERLAQSLRKVGSEVVVIEDASEGRGLCATHPPQLLAEDCAGCGKAICPGCRLDAGGAAFCGACARAASSKARTLRVRQLFAVFVFAIFVFQLWKFDVREEDLLRPSGPIDVAIYQFVRPEAVNSDLVRTLNSADPVNSLRAIAPWYTREHARYTGDADNYLDLTVHGPWVADVDPPELADPDASWWKLMYQSWMYPRYFHELARERGQDPDRRGARVYLVYGLERGDLAADSRGSRKGRIAVSFIPVDSSSVAYAQVTVAHELTHVLGAFDLYDEDTYLAKFPEGYVQPWADPLFPQRYAEVMAVDIPYSPTDEREIKQLDDVRIGYRTAADIGWISPEQADLYFAPSAVSPDAMLGPPRPDKAAPAETLRR